MIDETTPQEDMIRMYRKLRADFLHVREIGVTSLTSLQKDLEEVFSDTAQADAARAEAECKAEELQSLLSASQTQITGLQQELASSRESVQQQKEALLATLVSDRLEASDEDYARLATRPAESLTLHERVQQKIWTVVHHHRSREAAAAEHVRELSLRVQTQALETAQARRAAEAAEQELASVNARLEAQRGEQELQARKLNGLLTEAHADVAEMRDKARRYDDVCLRVRSLEEENARLTFERGEREARQSGLEERCDGIIARERDYEQQIKLLALDKVRLCMRTSIYCLKIVCFILVDFSLRRSTSAMSASRSGRSSRGSRKTPRLSVSAPTRLAARGTRPTLSWCGCRRTGG
jgi:chromosome segregation ATPase